MYCLSVNDLSVAYGGAQVLWNVSFNVEEKGITALLGSNGAGKSTILKTISGLMNPISGEIVFEGRDVTHLPTYKRVENGMCLVPEGRRLFSSLSVQENLEAGAYNKRARLRMNDTIERIYQLFPVLKERKKQSARTLSGGEQQMLAIGRGLMSLPTLFMLDEPSLGLAPLLVSRIFEAIRRIKSEGETVLIVEQNVWNSLRIADSVNILENGRITIQGSGEELAESEIIKKAYLGL